MARARLRNPASTFVGISALVLVVAGVGVSVVRGRIAENLSRGFSPASRSKDYKSATIDADVLADSNVGGGAPLTFDPTLSQITVGRRILVVLAQLDDAGKPKGPDSAIVARYCVTNIVGATIYALLESEHVGPATSKIAPVGGLLALSIDQVAALVGEKAKAA